MNRVVTVAAAMLLSAVTFLATDAHACMKAMVPSYAGKPAHVIHKVTVPVVTGPRTLNTNGAVAPDRTQRLQPTAAPRHR